MRSKPHLAWASGSAMRTLGLAALALLLLAGTLEIHPADEAADLHAGPQLYFPGASHPDQPEHLETSPERARPHCAACLNRLQSCAAGLPSPLEQAAPPAAERLYGGVSSRPLQTARGDVRGRAPPLS